MSLGAAFDVKEQVRQAVDIVELLGEYLSLRREGSAYKALCPWHDDKRPSLTVNPQRQSFRCWVCDIGGDVFTFIMKREGVSFPEALQMLAQRAGIALPTTPGGKSPRVSVDEKRLLYDTMAWVERQYHDCLLRSPEAEPARKYLRQRQISDDSLKRFHLGFAPQSWDWLRQRAASEGRGVESLTAVGALGRSERSGRYYDRFRGRVLFSIRDLQGRPIGIGGRELPEFAGDKSLKYINSPETPLFAKSKLLYGLDEARNAITKQREAIVVEGYTDCLIAHQLGLKNVVAVLGTALGEAHIRALRPMADRIVLLLDGDDAGRRRANEVLELFLAQQMDLRILTLPDDLDPCDFLLQFGAEELQRRIGTAADALEHKLAMAQARGAEGGLQQRHAALEDVLGALAQCPTLAQGGAGAAKVKEDLVLNRLAFRFGVPETTLRERVQTMRNASRRGHTAPDPDGGEGLEPRRAATEAWEQPLLELVLLAADLFDEVRSALEPEDFQSPRCQALYKACLRLHDAGLAPTYQRLGAAVEHPRLQSLLVMLDEQGHAKFADKDADAIEASLRETLANFLWRNVQQQQGHEIARLREPEAGGDLGKQVLEQIIQRQRDRQGISLPTEG